MSKVRSLKIVYNQKGCYSYRINGLLLRTFSIVHIYVVFLVAGEVIFFKHKSYTYKIHWSMLNDIPCNVSRQYKLVTRGIKRVYGKVYQAILLLGYKKIEVMP